MSLQSWLQNSWLVQRATSPEEIKNLLAISDRDLLACQVKQLPADRIEAHLQPRKGTAIMPAP